MATTVLPVPAPPVTFTPSPLTLNELALARVQEHAPSLQRCRKQSFQIAVVGQDNKVTLGGVAVQRCNEICGINGLGSALVGKDLLVRLASSKHEERLEGFIR